MLGRRGAPMLLLVTLAYPSPHGARIADILPPSTTTGSVCARPGVRCRDGTPVALNRYGSGVTGQLAEEAFRNLTGLETVSFGYNELEGSVPALAPARNLRFVDFSLNFLSGTLPDLRGLTALETLRIGYNFISGTFPALDSAPRLIQLDLHANRISGTLPPTLQRWPQLENLNVYENRLSGSIPALTGLARLKKAYFLKQLKPGGFSGRFPAASCEFLADLDAEFDGSKFECPLPACVPARFHASCVKANQTESVRLRPEARSARRRSQRQLAPPPPPGPSSGLKWRAVSSGGQHTCGLLEGLRVDNAKCWGDNSKHQCAVPAGVAWRTISAGDGDHTCGLTTTHGVLCWGSMRKGAAGSPRLPVPTVAGGFFAVAAGRYHVCAITLASRSMMCWGSAADGGAVMHPPAGIKRWASVTAGAFASCGATEDGRVECWGCSYTDGCKFPHGQSDPPKSVALNASSVATGAYSSCALRQQPSPSATDNLACWGTDVNGEISFPAGFVWQAVSPGRYGSCGIARGGLLLCWAMRGICMEEYERTYSGHCNLNQSAMPIAQGRRWASVSAGSWHACAIDDAAGLWCWGSNSSGQAAVPVKTDDVTGSAPRPPAPSRTVMAWMGWDGRTDAQLDEIVGYFVNHTDLITTASPTSHSLGVNGTLVERNLSSAATSTRAEVFKRLRAGGVRVVPTIFNDAGGMHTTLLPRFLQLAAAPDAFIASAVALAVAEDLDGWNVDMELGAGDWAAGDCRLVWPDPRWGPRCEKIQQAAALFAKFLDQFAKALHKANKTLSVDIGTDTNPLCAPITGAVPKIAKGCYSQWWMHTALNDTAVDRFISMTTYQSFQHFVIGTASMLARFSDYHGSSRTGLAGPTTALGFLTGEHYSTEDLRRRFAVLDGLQVQELDIWFVDDVHGGVPANWEPFLRRFVAGSGSSSLSSEEPPPPSAPSNRTALAWMGWGHRTDALIDAEVAWFTARRDELTASPTCHTLSPNGSLLEWPLAPGAQHTPISVWKQLRAGGVKVLPTIYNDANGYHTTLLPQFLAMAAKPDSFIQQAVSLAVENDLEGWNIE